MGLIRWRLGEPYSWAQVIAELAQDLAVQDPAPSTDDKGPVLSDRRACPERA